MGKAGCIGLVLATALAGAALAEEETRVTAERTEGPAERGTLYWDALDDQGRMIGGAIEEEWRTVEVRVRALDGRTLSEQDRIDVVPLVATCPEGQEVRDIRPREEGRDFIVAFLCVRQLSP